MHIRGNNRVPKWTVTLFTGISVCIFSVACNTTPIVKPAYKITGSFTDDTATRSSKNASCNTQVRVGNWAGFGTAYVEETTITSNRYYSDRNCGLDDCISAQRASKGKGRFFFGYDPDQTIDYRTTDVSKRWGGFNSSQTYLESGKDVPDGVEGIYFRIEDAKSGRRKNLRVSIAHRGLYKLMKARGLIDQSKVNKKLSVTFQFDKGIPFEQPSHLTPYPVFSHNGVMTMPYWGNSWVTTKEQNRHRDKLFDYLLNPKQPTSLLNISLAEDTGQVLYVAKMDMQDARSAFWQAYLEYQNILVVRNCAA